MKEGRQTYIKQMYICRLGLRGGRQKATEECGTQYVRMLGNTGSHTQTYNIPCMVDVHETSFSQTNLSVVCTTIELVNCYTLRQNHQISVQQIHLKLFSHIDFLSTPCSIFPCNTFVMIITCLKIIE